MYACVRASVGLCIYGFLPVWPSMRLSVCLPLTSIFKLICVLDVAQTRPGAPELDPTHAQALNWITIIGCSLSGVGLLLTLLSASCVR